MNGFRSLWVTLAFAAGLTGLLLGLQSQSGRLATVFWRAQLNRAADDQVRVLLQHLAAWDELAIPILVESLNSPRKIVADESYETLLETIDGWGQLDSRSSSDSEKLACLAETLAHGVGQFGPEARTRASQLATQILVRPLDERAAARHRATAACDRVVRIVRQLKPKPVNATRKVELANSATGPATVAKEEKQNAGESPKSAEPDLPSSSSSQASANENVQPISSPAVQSPVTAGMSTLAQPAGLLDRLQPSGGVFANQPSGLSVDRDSTSGAPAGALRVLAPPPKPCRATRDELSDQEPRPLVDSRESVDASVDTVEWMRRLQSVEPAESSAAREELVRRGFSEIQMELARRLFDPDPQVRKQLVRVLPELRSINAGTWLLQLCRDEDPQVRLEAFSLLATTPDPRLQGQLAELARQDPDPDVRRQAERLAGHRDDQQQRRR